MNTPEEKTKTLYTNAINDFMEQDPKLHGLNDFEFDFILDQLTKKPLNDLGEVNHTTDLCQFVILNKDFYQKSINEELHSLNKYNEIKDHTFIVISNGDDTSNEKTIANGFTYHNNQVFNYESDRNIQYISSNLNINFKKNKSKLQSDVVKIDGIKPHILEKLLKQPLANTIEVNKDLNSVNKFKLK